MVAYVLADQADEYRPLEHDVLGRPPTRIALRALRQAARLDDRDRGRPVRGLAAGGEPRRQLDRLRQRQLLGGLRRRLLLERLFRAKGA